MDLYCCRFLRCLEEDLPLQSFGIKGFLTDGKGMMVNAYLFIVEVEWCVGWMVKWLVGTLLRSFWDNSDVGGCGW